VDFWQTMRVLLRRWYVVVAVFALVVGVAGVMAYSAPRPYESTGTVVLTEPTNGGPTRGTINPLFSFDDSLTTTSQLLIQSLNSPAANLPLHDVGNGITFLASDGALHGPFIVVTADSPSADGAQAIVTAAFAFIDQQLDERQRTLGAPPSSYIVVKQVVAPTPPTLKLGGKSRFALATGLIGLIAALTAAFGVDTYSRRRRRVVRTAQVAV
jgi:hypothetical protein